MKKLIVDASDLPDEVTNNLNLFLTMQYTYGVSDFDVDKVVAEACKAFSLQEVDREVPFVYLVAASTASVTLKFIQEDYGS